MRERVLSVLCPMLSSSVARLQGRTMRRSRLSCLRVFGVPTPHVLLLLLVRLCSLSGRLHAQETNQKISQAAPLSGGARPMASAAQRSGAAAGAAYAYFPLPGGGGTSARHGGCAGGEARPERPNQASVGAQGSQSAGRLQRDPCGPNRLSGSPQAAHRRGRHRQGGVRS